MKLLKLICALKGGEDYPKDLYPKRNRRTFLIWDCLIFKIDKGQHMEFAVSQDYTYRPTVLLSMWIFSRTGKCLKLVCIQDLKEFIIKEACAVDIATEIMNGNMAAMNLRRYIA